MKLPPAIHFLPVTAISATEMKELIAVSTKDDSFAFHFLRLIAPSAMSRVPIPPPKIRDLVLPAMANPASPPSATNSPHGSVEAVVHRDPAQWFLPGRRLRRLTAFLRADARLELSAVRCSVRLRACDDAGRAGGRVFAREAELGVLPEVDLGSDHDGGAAAVV